MSAERPYEHLDDDQIRYLFIDSAQELGSLAEVLEDKKISRAEAVLVDIDAQMKRLRLLKEEYARRKKEEDT